jgi:hypothetical protein
MDRRPVYALRDMCCRRMTRPVSSVPVLLRHVLLRPPAMLPVCFSFFPLIYLLFMLKGCVCGFDFCSLPPITTKKHRRPTTVYALWAKVLSMKRVYARMANSLSMELVKVTYLFLYFFPFVSFSLFSSISNSLFGVLFLFSSIVRVSSFFVQFQNIANAAQLYCKYITTATQLYCKRKGMSAWSRLLLIRL